MVNIEYSASTRNEWAYQQIARATLTAHEREFLNDMFLHDILNDLNLDDMFDLIDDTAKNMTPDDFAKFMLSMCGYRKPKSVLGTLKERVNLALKTINMQN